MLVELLYLLSVLVRLAVFAFFFKCGVTALLSSVSCSALVMIASRAVEACGET